MRIIDADKMIADTKAMQKYIAEGITCDGIIKYLEDHSIAIPYKLIPCKLDEIFYYPIYYKFFNSQGELKKVSNIREVKVCSLTLEQDGTWNITASYQNSMQKFTVEDIGIYIFRDKKEAKKKIRGA